MAPLCVSWGDADSGGDSGAVQRQLRNVHQFQASTCAFVAILSSGSVVTYHSAVQDQLRNVRQIQASFFSFAAILGNGSVLTWGVADKSGDSSAVKDQLRNVQQIQASESALAAILADGSVVTWGCVAHGGNSSAVQHQLRNDPCQWLRGDLGRCRKWWQQQRGATSAAADPSV